METLQPKLRFPQFKGNWKRQQLGDVGDIKMCRRIFNEETTTTGDIPFFKIGSFGKVADAFISKELYINYRSRFSFPKKGDILISAAGTIGRTVIYNGEDAYFQDSNIVWIDNDNTITSNEFLFYVYQIVSFNTEGGTIQRLYNNILKSTKFFNPSLDEQTKIANFLSSVDEKLNLLKEKKTLLEDYKKGIMQKIFNQEIRFKDDNGSDFEDWEEKQIKDIFKVTRGTVLSMLKVNEHIQDNFIYPVYSSQTKQKGLAGYYSTYLFENAITWTTDGAGAGDVKYRQGKFYCTNVCGVLLNEDGYCNLFLAEILNSVSRKYVSYIGNPKLMNNVMADIMIYIPASIKEQNKISEFLSAIDEKIDLVTNQMQETQEYKKGLLQQMFI